MSDLKQFLIIKKRTGQCLCVLEQLPENDSIGRSAAETLWTNGYISVLTSCSILDHIEIPTVAAADLNEWLVKDHILPY